MTAALQLNPPLPMSCPKGEGFAHFLIDYGPESDLYWTVFITETGEIWTYANKHVRASKNTTLGRTLSKAGTNGVGMATQTGGTFESDAKLRERLLIDLNTIGATHSIPEAQVLTGRDLDALAGIFKVYRRYEPPQL